MRANAKAVQLNTATVTPIRREGAAMMPKLEELLSLARADIAALRRHGHPDQARAIATMVNEFENVVRPHFALMPEEAACQFTGLQPRALRERYSALEARGLACLKDNVRHYCAAALPARSRLTRITEDGTVTNIRGSRGRVA